MAKKKRVRRYNKKCTQKELDEMEATIIRCSQVYRWLRQDAGLSKNKIRKSLNIRFDKIYETFRYPYEEMKLHQIYDISNLLPEKTLFEIMKAINPDYNKHWYEIEDWEEIELKNMFDKFKDE